MAGPRERTLYARYADRHWPIIRNVSFATLLALLTALTGAILTARAQDGPRIVWLGDSLVAGYELPPDAAYPAQLAAALKGKGVAAVIENAGVSGDTSTGGLERLDWAVSEGVKGVILELGANDALRGIDPAITRSNLDAMITRLKARNVAVFLIGMRAPPNNGPNTPPPSTPSTGPGRTAWPAALSVLSGWRDGQSGTETARRHASVARGCGADGGAQPATGLRMDQGFAITCTGMLD